MKPATYLLFASIVASGCTPYEKRSGEFNAGPVDPVKFPAAYLGSGGDPKQAGGTFNASAAYVNGKKVGYYPFPFSAAQFGTAASPSDDPLAITENGGPDTFTAPNAYVFDPGSTKANCVPTPGYVYDERRDGIHYDDQGNLFTALPASAAYVPVVAEVAVTSNGEGCQSIKSTATLVTDSQVTVQLKQPPAGSPPTAMATGVPDGKYLAWAIIDPSATVNFPNGMVDANTGLGPQKYGWYQHYLVAYLDGGYIPTMNNTLPGSMGMPGAMVNDMVPQILFVPSAIPAKDMKGNPVIGMTKGKPGSGFDVLQAARGDAAYSPVCQVMVFTPADPMNPTQKAADIDMTTVKAAPTPYIYCLQVE
jgi:hypothetical protein